MKTLTECQKETLNYISQFTEENDFPPTVREMSEKFNISLRAVQDRIAALQKKGYLSQCEKRARSIRVISDCREKENKLFVVTPLLYESRQDKRAKGVCESLDCKDALQELENKTIKKLYSDSLDKTYMNNLKSRFSLICKKYHKIAKKVLKYEKKWCKIFISYLMEAI